MARPQQVEDMLQLEVGQHLLIQPDTGEELDRALRRIKLRASKHRARGRSYTVEVAGDGVRVERVPFGQNKKLRRFEDMKVGEVVLMSETATEKDLKSARNTVNYLHGKVRRGNGKQWRAVENKGRVYIRCVYDEATDRIERDNRQRRKKSAVENLENDIAIFEWLAEKFRRDLIGYSGSMKEFLWSQVYKYENHIRVLRHALFYLDQASRWRIEQHGLKCCTHISRG